MECQWLPAHHMCETGGELGSFRNSQPPSHKPHIMDRYQQPYMDENICWKWSNGGPVPVSLMIELSLSQLGLSSTIGLQKQGGVRLSEIERQSRRKMAHCMHSWDHIQNQCPALWQQIQSCKDLLVDWKDNLQLKPIIHCNACSTSGGGWGGKALWR